ncbi:serine protease inhibitor [Halostreptopolyspora alba]|uniref:Proteinase inhibitor I78 n=1 Tax=Halostreptopolyspora alba TaxID=2487137 RepID=A0A3N0E9G1_9ACTN|nr:hypothetical protein EFW17_12780 [Nocardiopsaceae bacterium YIM 96095]
MRGLTATATVVGTAVLFALGPAWAASASDTGSPSCAGKQEWPELVGTEATRAQEVIQRENPNVTDTTITPLGSPVTTDYRCDRVRVPVEEKADTTVAATPRVG